MESKKQKPIKMRIKPVKGKVNFRGLIIAWSSVLVLLVVAFFVGKALGEFAPDSAFSLLTVITAFAAFVVQSIFSFSVLKHNENIRELNDEMKRNSDDVNARAEAFRTLQFIASNYTVVDFVDYMLLYDESDRYTKRLKETKDFTFYLKEDNVDLDDIFEHFDDYRFLSVKLPLSVVEGKSVGKIRFSRFKFTKEDGVHRFIPCGGPDHSLILFNETDRRSEVVINLITKKTSEFYAPHKTVPFTKIKISLSMQSLLGVAVTGTIELYFTNPEKLEKSGANKYKINSSHFEVTGLPVLLNPVESDIKTEMR